MIDTAFDRSALLRVVRRAWGRVRAVGSRVFGLPSTPPWLRRLGSTSRVVALVRNGRTALTSSVLYRWLTAEPEPEVIVIDLRQTWTVGPILRVVDWFIGGLEAWFGTSSFVEWCRYVGSAVRARPLRLASAVVLSAVAVSLLVVAADGSPSEPMLYSLLVAAGLAALGLRSRTTLDDFFKARVGRWLAAAFEPPEPPERVENESRQGEEDAQ